MEEKGKDFDKIFIEAVDEGLDVLGESGKQMIFFHLEKSYSIKRHEIPKKSEAFAAGLEKIFGAGALVLEKLIVKNLYSKLGLKYEDKEERPFADYMNDVKKGLRNQYPPRTGREQVRDNRPARSNFVSLAKILGVSL